MQRIVWSSLALLFFLGSFASFLLQAQDRQLALRGYVNPTEDARLPFYLVGFGVNADLLQYDTDTLSQHLEWMQEIGVRWVRQPVYWDEIESVQGLRDWGRFDEVFDILAEHALIEMVPVLLHTPEWARNRTDSGQTAPPDDLLYFADFAQAFAQRYGENVSHYQIWDEPNITTGWGNQAPNPALYTALLIEASLRIREHDPQAVIISAALAPTTERGPINISDWMYLESLYELGAQNYFDAVGAKAYGFDTPPNDRRVHEDVLNFSRVIALREIMTAHNDHLKPVWIMNWGWNHQPDDWQGEASIWGSVTSAAQQQYVLDALQRAELEWPWLQGFILHQWDAQEAPESAQWGFSLIGQDDQPGELWAALRDRPSSVAARTGLHHPQSHYARYSGIWTLGTMGADIGWLETSDSVLEFDFEGQQVALLLRQGDYIAFLYPTVDGAPGNALPQDNQGNAYIFLRSDSLETRAGLELIARDLEDGPHTLSVIADRGWDQWAIAAYAINTADIAAPYDFRVRISLVLLVVSLAVVLLAGYRYRWIYVLRQGFVPLRRLDRAAYILISFVTSLALMFSMLITWPDSMPLIFRRDALQFGLANLIAGGLLTFQPGFIAVILSALLLFVMIYNRLLVGLMLIVFWCPFFLFPVELFSFAVPMAEMLVFITFAAWLLRLLVSIAQHRRKGNQTTWLIRISTHWNPFDSFVLGFVLLASLSLLWVSYPGAALTEWRVLILEPALFYGLMRVICSDRKDLSQIAISLVLAALCVCGIGLYLYIQGEAVITAEQGARRLASVYGSPNNVALLIGRIVPFVLAGFLIIKSSRPYLAAALALMLITILLTQSAGALIFGLPAGVFAVLILFYGRKALGLVLGLSLAGMAGVFAATQVSARFARLIDFTEGTNFIRLRVWESAINIIRDNPITGIGLDQFLYLYRSRYIRPDAIWDSDLSHPHNFILDFWLRLGLAGIALFVWLQLQFWRISYGIYRKAVDPADRTLLLGSMGCMASLLAHGLVDNSIFVNDLVYVFMFVLAIPAILMKPHAIDAKGN